MTALASLSSRPLSIIELCLSTGRGGLEGYAAGLVNDLEARGHRVQVVARPDSDFAARSNLTPALTLAGSRYYPLAGARKLAHLAKNADVIHIHRSADLPLAAAAKLLSRNHPKLVYSRHMAITRDRRKSPVHRLMFRQVDLMLTITGQVAAAARARLPLPSARIRHLPPGVETGTRRIDCETLRPPETDFVVGCFSRLEPAKGQHELIEALNKLGKEGLRIGAIIAGPAMDSAYAERLRRQAAAAGLEARVNFAGALEDARPAMACCDAVVMPSQAETLGLVLIEAMLQGVPVVATAAGGVLEVINNGETGLTYPVGDTDALARCLARLAKYPEFRAGLARAGQAMARERHDRARHLAQLEQILSALQRREGARAN
jgi:L-malate glycosyltransferase